MAAKFIEDLKILINKYDQGNYNGRGEKVDFSGEEPNGNERLIWKLQCARQKLLGHLVIFDKAIEEIRITGSIKKWVSEYKATRDAIAGSDVCNNKLAEKLRALCINNKTFTSLLDNLFE